MKCNVILGEQAYDWFITKSDVSYSAFELKIIKDICDDFGNKEELCENQLFVYIIGKLAGGNTFTF